MLGVQLMSVNAYLHTSLMYGQWEGWDGNPLDEPPLFYCGLTESRERLERICLRLEVSVYNKGNLVVKINFGSCCWEDSRDHA